MENREFGDELVYVFQNDWNPRIRKGYKIFMLSTLLGGGLYRNYTINMT